MNLNDLKDLLNEVIDSNGLRTDLRDADNSTTLDDFVEELKVAMESAAELIVELKDLIRQAESDDSDD